MGNKGIQRSFATLATGGILAASFAFAATPAFAGQSTGCDVSVATLLKVSAEDGKPLAGATFKVEAAPNVYLKGGDASADESKFTEVFSGTFKPLNATDAGAAIEDAYLHKLGRDFVGYPSDYTNSAVAQQASSIMRFQNDEDGTLAPYEADLIKRLDALNKVLSTNPDLQAKDPAYFTHVSGEAEKLTRNYEALKVAKSTTDWDTFVTNYRVVIDKNNWSFGLSKEPSVVYQDFLNGVNSDTYAKANAAGAEAIKATPSLSVTTDKDGKAVFTLFGMKEANADGYTRGDLTCDQLAGKAIEVTAPNGYVLDATPHSFVSNDKQVITFTVKNSLSKITPSPTPTPTPTKPGGKVDTGAPTSSTNWLAATAGLFVIAAGGGTLFLVARRRKDAEGNSRAH